MDKKIGEIAEYVNTEKHIVSLTKGLSEMIPFWICMCLFFMVMVHFLPYESVFLMSRIAIVIMMAAMTYAVSTGIGDNSPVFFMIKNTFPNYAYCRPDCIFKNSVTSDFKPSISNFLLYNSVKGCFHFRKIIDNFC